MYVCMYVGTVCTVCMRVCICVCLYIHLQCCDLCIQNPTHPKNIKVFRSSCRSLNHIGGLVVICDHAVPKRQNGVRLVVTKDIMPRGKVPGKVFGQK